MRRTCHRPTNDWTVIVERRRRERTSVIRSRIVCGGSVVGCIWSCSGSGSLTIVETKTIEGGRVGLLREEEKEK